MDIDQRVDFAITGKEALDTIKESYEMGITYAFVFTDFSMPVMNGIDCTRSIREHLQRKIPRSEQPLIIGITGHV